MKVRWTAEAADDLKLIYSNVQLHYPQFLERTMRQIYSEIGSLRTRHVLGRPHPEEPHCREWIFAPTPYVCVYRVEEYGVTILQIRHGARADAHIVQ